ncbi:hypothetical protein DENSPDRAFT_260727 [Dentipellis sp. KUC8613]|nr:hypothetical protein DENSPDRAFT_260727 [Dentipellis sp. KUC8613]
MSHSCAPCRVRASRVAPVRPALPSHPLLCARVPPIRACLLIHPPSCVVSHHLYHLTRNDSPPRARSRRPTLLFTLPAPCRTLSSAPHRPLFCLRTPSVLCVVAPCRVPPRVHPLAPSRALYPSPVCPPSRAACAPSIRTLHRPHGLELGRRHATPTAPCVCRQQAPHRHHYTPRDRTSTCSVRPPPPRCRCPGPRWLLAHSCAKSLANPSGARSRTASSLSGPRPLRSRARASLRHRRSPPRRCTLTRSSFMSSSSSPSRSRSPSRATGARLRRTSGTERGLPAFVYGCEEKDKGVLPLHQVDFPLSAGLNVVPGPTRNTSRSRRSSSTRAARDSPVRVHVDFDVLFVFCGRSCTRARALVHARLRCAAT